MRANQYYILRFVNIEYQNVYALNVEKLLFKNIKGNHIIDRHVISF